jgi:hypothetical protein
MPNLFSYLSPTRSPYYATTVACVVALLDIAVGKKSMIAPTFNAFSGHLSLFYASSSKFWFNRSEYNDQLNCPQFGYYEQWVACLSI